MTSTVSNTALRPTARAERIPLHTFNAYRKGLQLFVLLTRDGHEKGYLWAGSSHAANGRAQSLIGSGATVTHAGSAA